MKKKKFSREVAIVGAGISKFGAFPEKASRDLFVEAFEDMALSVERGWNPKEIEALYLGNFSGDLFEGQGHLAPIMAQSVGLVPRPAVRVEGACASGGLALRDAILGISSGLYDMVLVGGVEKMTNLPTAQVTDALGAASDILFELKAGFSFPGLYAAMTTAYMAKYGMQPEDLRHVTIKNHTNGALNPKAQFNMTILDWMKGRIEAAQKKGKPVPTWKNMDEFFSDDSANPMIAWPLRLFDCSPVTDGAATLLLVSADRVKEFTDKPIYVLGAGQASDVPLHSRVDFTTLPAAVEASRIAYEMAGVKPSDIRLAEVHDCFTMAEIIAMEDLGFCNRGEGYRKAKEGVTGLKGEKPINSSGGLKAKGHPVGASGVAQVYEIFKQMRGEAGPRQVEGDLSLALTHNVGATGTTCVVHIYERR